MSINKGSRSGSIQFQRGSIKSTSSSLRYSNYGRSKSRTSIQAIDIREIQVRLSELISSNFSLENNCQFGYFVVASTMFTL